jgi:peptidoglycan hydrolase CwlO-like protein
MATQTQLELRARYQAVHDALMEARLRCTDSAKRTELRHKADEVQEVLTAIDRQELQSRTGAFRDVAAQMENVNESLSKLKGEIDKITNDIACAAKVVSAIDGVLKASAKFVA